MLPRDEVPSGWLCMPGARLAPWEAAGGCLGAPQPAIGGSWVDVEASEWREDGAPVKPALLGAFTCVPGAS